MSKPLNIFTPCHGKPLSIYTSYEGPAYMQSEVPSEIVCDADGCYNSWKPDGTVEYWREDD